MNFDLNLLKCFHQVAVNKSISLASSTLHLSQPAVSLQIKKLEDQLGKALFDRHNRGLILTPFGHLFLEKTNRILKIQDEMTDLAKASESTPSGQLRVGTYTTASSYLLAPCTTQFLTQFKEVSLSYDYSESKILLEKIKNYQLECAVLTDVPPDKQLHSQPFFKDELIFVISSDRRASKTKNIQPKDLSKFDFLSYPLRYDLCYRTVEAKFGTYLSQCRIPLETESFDTLKQMLLLGVGATFIPKYLIAKELKSGQLTEIHIGQSKLPIHFSVVTKKESDLSTAAKFFIKNVIDSFS